jgi:hypothetical protein
MALDILEQDNYLHIKKILNDENIDEHSLIKRGLRKAA